MGDLTSAPILFTMIKSAVLLLSIACLFSLSLGNTIPAEEIQFLEMMAFKVCDSDKMMGLTWLEVEKCEEKFADLLTLEDIPIPSKEDFDAADGDRDGILYKEEWNEWISGP